MSGGLAGEFALQGEYCCACHSSDYPAELNHTEGTIPGSHKR